MSDFPAASSVVFPAELDADDVLALRDQTRARIEAVISTKKQKKGDPKDALPEGLSPLKELPLQLEKPWNRFNTAVDALQELRNTRTKAKAEAASAALDTSEQEAANADADDRWRALERWLAGASGLAEDDGTPSPAEARWLFGQLFPAPDGLRFITRRSRAQWTAMEQRMSVLASDRAKAVVKGFHGERYVAQLEKAHKRFGKAFGFTQVQNAPSEGPSDGRPQWLNAREALRVLVQKLESYGDPEIEGTEALSAFLLAPFIEVVNDYARSRRAPKNKDNPSPETATSSAKKD